MSIGSGDDIVTWWSHSAEAVARLRAKGFKARRLEFGLTEWKKARLEVESAAPYE